MGLSPTLTSALPPFACCLLLLAAGIAFARAEGPGISAQITQAAISQTLPVNNSAISGQSIEMVMPSNAALQTNENQPATQANISSDSAILSHARISLQKTGGQLLLEARQAPLADILQTITEKTGAQIHYSVLPEGPVSATCAGKTAQAVMECLVAKQIGLVAHKATKTKPAEFWLLGSSVGSCRAVTVAACPVIAQPVVEQPPTAEEQSAIDAANLQQTEMFLGQIKTSKTLEQKTEALANLASSAKIDNPDVRRALDDALDDKEPALRVQAINTLAHLDKDNMAEVLSRGMKDKDIHVRLAAVDKAQDVPEILEQALADSDKNVRDYANAKLAELNKIKR
ncbi:MAG: HEAT repeat domain-containing protein [Methyloglobulus sp.]|nr:HEAT repeat domain-containing protein [Methyloglobulus sp.]